MGGMQRRLLSIVAVAGVAAVGAACSSSPPQAAYKPVGPPTGDAAVAVGELLSAAQGPTGWTASNDQPTTMSGHKNTQLAHCEHTATPSGSAPATAEAPAWTSQEGASITDEAEVFKTAGDAASDFSLYTSAAAPPCVQGNYQSQIESEVSAERSQGASIGTVTAVFRPVSLLATGAKISDVEVNMPVTQPGQGTLNAYVDECVIQKGRSETQLIYTSTAIQPDAQIISILASAAAAKMQ